MLLGKLNFEPIKANHELIGKATLESINKNKLDEVMVAKIDPTQSDTEAFLCHI